MMRRRATDTFGTLLAITTGSAIIAGIVVLFAVMFVPQEPYGGWPILGKIATAFGGISFLGLLSLILHDL